MNKAISDTRKKGRGRPRVDATQIGLRLPPDQLAVLDVWIAKQKEPDLSRPEAIRRLVEIGLAKSSPSDRLRATRAKELAERAIEKVGDPAAPPAERAERRRRLTKGPSEFRDDRVDQPKAEK